MKVLYKVLICGDRNWDDPDMVRNVITGLKSYADGLNQELLIISGGAEGADKMAKRIGNELDVHVAEVDALWDTRHRSAGPQRNMIMLSLQPDAVVAFHNNIEKSRGTAHTVRHAKKAGIPTQVVSTGEEK